MHIGSRCRVFLVLLGSLFPLVAWAAGYPEGPIKLIAPFPPGSVPDLRARHIGNLLSVRTGKPVIIENKPGASGSIGASIVARAKPDGYTLLLCTTSSLAGNAALLPSLPYDPERDFAPISRLVTTFGVVAVSAGSSIQSFEQLVAAAKKNPGGLRYGAGSSYSHILGELVSKRAGVKLLHVPYKGDAQAITDLIGGHIDIIFTTPLSLLSNIRAGRLRPLAIAGRARLSGLKSVPTLAELGVRDSELGAWSGLCAPTRTPAEVVRVLHDHIVAAMSTPEVKRESEEQGYEVAVGTPEEFRRVIKLEIARTKSLVSELKIPKEQ